MKKNIRDWDIYTRVPGKEFVITKTLPENSFNTQTKKHKETIIKCYKNYIELLQQKTIKEYK